jgi:hypothetical protein
VSPTTTQNTTPEDHQLQNHLQFRDGLLAADCASLALLDPTLRLGQRLPPAFRGAQLLR